MLPELHQAATTGDIAAMERLLKEGVPIDLLNESTGHTALMSTCLSPAAKIEAVRWLVEHGTDVNAIENAPPPPSSDFSELLEDEDLDPETRRLLETSKSLSEDVPPNHQSVLSLAIKNAPIEVIDFLIKNGADLGVQTESGYTITIDAVYREDDRILDLVLEAGAPLDGVTSYGESAVNVLSHRGRFAALHNLLRRGADPTPLKWAPLMHAVSLGSISEVQSLLNEKPDLELTDYWSRTAFLLAVHAGDIEKATLLLEHGANPSAVGRCSKPALSHAVSTDNASMLDWLLDRGFEIDPVDEFKSTPLMAAAESGSVECFKRLIVRGADLKKRDHINESPIEKATDPEIIRLLIAEGEDPANLEEDELRKFIGLDVIDALPVTRETYEEGRLPRFGQSNPERMPLPFWEGMVRCGWSGFSAANQFGESSYERPGPVWCHDRFGMSLTCLPDGRFIQIAGEHEDHYDPDFCIYNDVFIHDGKGGLVILGYPRDVFPPTDFHSATFIDPWIYIIGNLGYPDDRGSHTPVFRLHIHEGTIEKVVTSGDDPGWIHSHTATFEDGLISISGGKRFEIDEDGGGQISDLKGSFSFDPDSNRWQRTTG